MRYSIYNPVTRSYKVFESNQTSLVVPVKSSNLGSVPESAVPVLPSGAKFLGESPVPEGQIVKSNGFTIYQFSLIVVAGVIAHWIYKIFGGRK